VHHPAKLQKKLVGILRELGVGLTQGQPNQAEHAPIGD